MKSLIKVNWPAPANVHAYSTTRLEGESEPPFDSFNLGSNTGDVDSAVASNREKLSQLLDLPSKPCWLNQVHGNRVVEASTNLIEADASVSFAANTICIVQTADCLPILLCNQAGDKIAAIHAGWRGLAAGIIENTLAKLEEPADKLLAWMGPAIGPQAFEVGLDVYHAFVDHESQNQAFFEACDAEHYLADLYSLARFNLNRLGVNQVFGGNYCTYQDKKRFFSYRRDGKTGRMASLIWIR